MLRHRATATLRHPIVYFIPFPLSRFFPLRPGRTLAVRRAARPLYSLRPFNSIATLFYKVVAVERRRKSAAPPSNVNHRAICQRSLCSHIDATFATLWNRLTRQFVAIRGDIYRDTWKFSILNFPRGGNRTKRSLKSRVLWNDLELLRRVLTYARKRGMAISAFEEVD